jgi:hypothetical protein
MFFKDWRLLDQSPVGLTFAKDRIYYVHSRAWALKGWLGGTHSWLTFWSDYHNAQLVVELTDPETIAVQHASILYNWADTAFQEHAPTISDRVADAKWFGSTPMIASSAPNRTTFLKIQQACEEYPIKKFRLIDQNCNTFVSYLNYKLNLKLKRPIRSIGFKNWEKYESVYQANSRT